MFIEGNEEQNFFKVQTTALKRIAHWTKFQNMVSDLKSELPAGTGIAEISGRSKFQKPYKEEIRSIRGIPYEGRSKRRVGNGSDRRTPVKSRSDEKADAFIYPDGEK